MLTLRLPNGEGIADDGMPDRLILIHNSADIGDGMEVADFDSSQESRQRMETKVRLLDMWFTSHCVPASTGFCGVPNDREITAATIINPASSSP